MSELFLFAKDKDRKRWSVLRVDSHLHEAERLTDMDGSWGASHSVLGGGLSPNIPSQEAVVETIARWAGAGGEKLKVHAPEMLKEVQWHLTIVQCADHLMENYPAFKTSPEFPYLRFHIANWIVAADKDRMPCPFNDERESDKESVDTLPARRERKDTVCHDPSCRAVISEMQADIRRQGKDIALLRKQLAWVIKGIIKILENQHTMQLNDIPRQPAPGSPEAAFPTNSLRRPISTKSDFQEVNSRLHDPQVKSQLTHFLVCLGGRNTDDFVKRVFYALFDDEACMHVNFRGKKTKEGLCGSQVYEVIKDVYAAWNKGGRVDVYELEAAFTRRLKRSLDALRKRRSRPDSLLDDELSTEPTSSRPRED
nr:unnamed protein product [Spirometra erinaceieuropaei]